MTTEQQIAERIERARDDERFTIWMAYEPMMGGCDSVVGYLVTAINDPDCPVAFVRYDDGASTGDDDREKAFRLAELIAYNEPETTDGTWIDLRGCGRFDSIEPMPKFLFGLMLAEVDGDGNDTGTDRWECEPFCRFALEKMLTRQQIERERQGQPDDVEVTFPEDTARLIYEQLRERFGDDDDGLELTPRMRYLLRLAQKLARQKREYDAAGVDGDGMFEPDLLGKAITNVTNRIAECLEYGDDQDDDAGDDDSQNDPPAADTDFGLDIDMSNAEPKPATA